MNKYEITDITIEHNGHTLRRIRYLKNIQDGFWASKGQLGGWVESAWNLSQYDDCVIMNDAKVYGEARIRDNVRVTDNAEVFDEASCYNDCCIQEYAKVFKKARIEASVLVGGRLEVSKTPIVITGLGCDIVITDNYITIGCETHSLEVWLDICNSHSNFKQITYEKYKNFKDNYKDFLVVIAKNHQTINL